MKILFGSAILGTAALASIGGCAAQSADTPQQRAFARSTCESVMHVRTNAELWGCMQSISDSMAQQAQSARSWSSDENCAAQGLRRDTPEFAVCVLQSRDSAQPGYGNVPSHLVTGSFHEAPNALGYYNGTFDAVRRREEYACAQIGLDPNFGRFSQCVDDLDGQMRAADNPPAG